MSASRHKQVASLKRMTGKMAVAYQHRKQPIPQTTGPRQLQLTRANKEQSK